MKVKISNLFALSISILLWGCGGSSSSNTNTTNTDTTPTTYSFESKFAAGENNVSYSGQIFRQLLVSEQNIYIGSLTSAIDQGSKVPVQGDIVNDLLFYYQFDSTTAGSTVLKTTTSPSSKESTFDEVSSAKNIKEKIAGNDLVGQYKDWSTEFKGWSDSSIVTTGGSISTPEGLILAFYHKLDQLAVNRATGSNEVDPSGNVISNVYVTSTGLDLKELIQKFTLGALAFSQGTDDYLDDDLDGKGLNSDNTVGDSNGTKNYSALEHAWDEGFGYFGAAQNYNDYTDDEIAGKGGRSEFSSGYHDTDGDGKISFMSEFNFGHSVNASKRDRDSNSQAPTDFSKGAFDAFLKGRAIITKAAGNVLSTQELTDLKVQRDIAIDCWEKAISSTVVHYINDVLKDMNKFGTSEYSFANHAKHWSELKGFALILQFNSRKLISDADFVTMHNKIGDKPVLENASVADISAYKASLNEVKTILQNSYSFSSLNMGDENGENGW